MTVEEVIKELQALPPTMEVVIWDEEQDEYMPVVQALHESGCSDIMLLTVKEDTVPADFEE